MSEQEKIQSLALELRILEGYIQEINARQSALTRTIIENRSALESLKALSDKEPSNLLLPLGGGAFLEATAPPPKKLVLNIGAGAMILKTKEDIISFLEEKIKELENGIRSLETQRGNIISKINANRTDINNLLQKQKTN